MANPSTGSASGRLPGIDLVRYLMCFPVAVLHALPGDAGVAATPWTFATALACRAAVPFFFIASGYFVRVPDRLTWAIFVRPLARLMPVFVFWTAFYVVLHFARFGVLPDLSVRALVSGGSAYHLWFIPAVAGALIAVPVGVRLVGLRLVLLGAAGITLMGLAYGSYLGVIHPPAIRGFKSSVAIRPCMAPLLVAIGHWLARHRVSVRTRTATLWVAGALLLSAGEELLLMQLGGTALASHDYVVMTFPFGVATFLLARNIGRARLVRLFARLGEVSLGVYASHLLWLDMLKPVIGSDSLWRVLATALGTLLLATATSLALDRAAITRRFVR